MFTGIVEHKGSVASTERGAGTMRVVLDVGPLTGLEVGDSISVDGVCLTAVDVRDGTIAVDIVQETIDRSNLGRLIAGDVVNLERPMSADGRFDGHIVQGHVDGTGVISRIEGGGDESRMEIEVPGDISRYIVEKGSVTVDGVSLTVAAVTGSGFEVALIPHTIAVTTLGLRQVGDRVNLEVDVLAKYVERLMGAGT